MTIELLFLRLVHVLGGVLWVGSVLFMSLFLAPALAATGPSGGQIFAALQKRGLPTILLVASLLTIASGMRLMWITSGGLASAYFATATGRTLVSAAAAAVTALLIGVLVGRPTAARAAKLGGAVASAPPEQRDALARELATLRRRSGRAGAAASTLLVLAAAGMAIARYVT